MSRTREVVLRRPPAGRPEAADFEVVEREVRDLADGEIRVAIAFQSLDPYLGSRLRGRHMGEPAPAPGQSLPGFSVGRVTASRHPGFAVGDGVAGECGWAEEGVLAGDAARKVAGPWALSAHLGVLGMPGLTAWAAMTQLAKVAEGDTVLVDAAAGPVGGTAGRLAKAFGARVIGVAGGAAKCARVTGDYGFDACVDYKADGWREALAEACAGGISVHMENVGETLLTTALGLLKPYGRVVLCGLAEHYHGEGPAASIPFGPVVGKRAQVFGLVVYDFYPRWAEWVAMAEPLMSQGLLQTAEDVSDGIETAPQQFERLMRGENVGKTLVRMG